MAWKGVKLLAGMSSVLPSKSDVRSIRPYKFNRGMTTPKLGQDCILAVATGFEPMGDDAALARAGRFEQAVHKDDLSSILRPCQGRWVGSSAQHDHNRHGLSATRVQWDRAKDGGFRWKGLIIIDFVGRGNWMDVYSGRE